MGLRHVLGDKPIPRLIDFLRVHREWDYPLSAISEATGTSYRTLQKIVPGLVKTGILVKTREVGKAKLYRLNFKSPAVQKLDAFAVAADLEFGHATKKPVPIPA